MRSTLTRAAAGLGLALALGQMAAAETYEVAVIRWAPNDIYFNGVELGQRLEAARIEAETGDTIEFRVFGANDVSEQLNALQAQVARGVDGVLLVPWRGEAMRGIVGRLAEEGTPVVTSNAWVPGSEQTFVAFDNAVAGRLGGEALVSRLDELRGEGWRDEPGVFIELRCIITASFDIARHSGYRSVLDPIAEANPDITIEEHEASCDGGQARKIVDDLISRHGGDRILGVASIDGTMGIGGAVPAFRAQGLLTPPDDPSHIPVATIDGTVPEFQALARGEIDHVSVQPATGEGRVSMRMLYTLMSGQELPEAESVLMEGEDPLWGPVRLMQPEEIDGPWYQIQAYSVPGDASLDDERNWANQMALETEGALPKYGQ